MMERNNAEQKAERFLSRADVFAMSIGIMVGWGAFVMPGTTFLPVAGPAGTVIAQAIRRAGVSSCRRCSGHSIHMHSSRVEKRRGL